MYVRQLKQFIRGVDTAFDERKWGYSTIMEFLRACQREGLFRLERDRRGQIRVFPGAALQTTPGVAPVAVPSEEPRETYDAEAVEPFDTAASPLDAEPFDSANVRLEPEPEPIADASEPNGNVIDMNEPPAATARGRRTRKSPAARPAARKPAGARPSSRRRKTPVPA
jgi:hypothetical protein